MSVDASHNEEELSITRMADPILEPKKASSNEALKDFVAGGVGGVAQLLTGHPLDTMKVKLQTGGTEYNGLTDVFKKILKNEGPKGFYKGVASPFIGFTGLNAILFTAYGVGNKLFRGDTPEGEYLPYSRVAMAGIFAGTQSSLVESPMDLFKSKMQSQKVNAEGKLQYRSTLDCVVQVVKNNGIRGVYQGLPATWARNIPANAFYFLGYEWAKRTLTPEGQDPSPIVLLVAGGVAGIAFWVGCYPLDAIKTVLQTDASTISERQYKSYMDCVKQMYAKGGIRRFYIGFAPCVIRSFPANASCFLGYELTKKLWN